MVTFGYDDLVEKLMYHDRTDVTAPKHNRLYEMFLALAVEMDEIIPNDGLYNFKAMERLEEALMWANKSVATLAPVSSTKAAKDDLVCIDSGKSDGCDLEGTTIWVGLYKGKEFYSALCHKHWLLRTDGGTLDLTP